MIPKTGSTYMSKSQAVADEGFRFRGMMKSKIRQVIQNRNQYIGVPAQSPEHAVPLSLKQAFSDGSQKAYFSHYESLLFGQMVSNLQKNETHSCASSDIARFILRRIICFKVKE